MPTATAGTTDGIEPDRSDGPRVFPCEGCGADLTFNIGEQRLKCSHCGYVKELDLDADAEVAEQDFAAMLSRLAERRRDNVDDDQGFRQVRCDSCAAMVRFIGTLTSDECPYCGVPLALAGVHVASDRVPVDGLLPFLIERDRARSELAKWIKSRWFAPNDFKARGIEGRFNGVYLPYWTFDSLTSNRYSGQRGVHYVTTVGSGKNRRTVVRTRWYPASGAFQRFFDDVLVVAGTGLPQKRLQALEPWPLSRCIPFNAEALAGFMARTYDVELNVGIVEGKRRMSEAIEADVRQRIGGDVQRIHSIKTRFDAVTYKHLLLPVWMLAYRYGKKSYQVVVNAGTGEVQGDRPYSWIKITLAVIAGLVAAAAIGFAVSQSQ